ncbi:MAG: ParB/RepB/Spo0J family partition protein [Myxococcota bacterium]|jgi:ParB family chromosome partitioning protein
MSEERSSSRKVLGKGISALIQPVQPAAAPAVAGSALRKWIEIKAIEDLEPGANQPRKTFNDGTIAELAASIREMGVIQPILVRRKGKGFEIIAGERRWRAAQAAGLKEVPVIVKDASDEEALELALIENIQRDDLNPLEEALAYERLIKNFSLTQEAVAARVGRERSTVANMVRLLALPEQVKAWLASGELSTGHARALLSLTTDPEKIKLAREIIERKLSVRQVEDAVRKGRTTRPVMIHTPPTQMKVIGDDLQRHLKTKVTILDKGKRGSIVIEYYSFEELDRLYQLLLGR